MLKASTQLTSMVEGKEGHLLLDGNTPLQIVKEMLFEFLTHVGNLEAQTRAQAAAIQVTDTPAENLPVMDVVETAPISQPEEPQA